MGQHRGDLTVKQVVAQPAGTYARQIPDRLLIDLAWNSSRLEGNTYSLLDTRRPQAGFATFRWASSARRRGWESP
jgi:hypothetical protein